MNHLHPFDQPEATACVLKNRQQQYSVWPGLMEIPAGWEQVAGPDTLEQCLHWLENHGDTLRPAPLTARENPHD